MASGPSPGHIAINGVGAIGNWTSNGCVRDDKGVASILAALPSLWRHRLIDIWGFIFLIWVNIFRPLNFRWISLTHEIVSGGIHCYS